jgi:putative ABC transport system substrate-binding protein
MLACTTFVPDVTRVAFAQSPRTARIGFLGLRPLGPWPTRAPFLEGLKERGWVEGDNLAIEWRFIVLAVGNPVVIGAAASYERPGGNITGPSTSNVQFTRDRLILLREAAGWLTRLGVLWNPSNRTKNVEWEKLRTEGAELGVETIPFETRLRGDIDTALTTARGAGLDGVMVLADPLTHSNIKLFADFAVEQHLPTVYDFTEGARAGILVSYGTDNLGLYRAAAVYVDSILRGADPAELPIEVPSSLDLVVNQKTAAALGLAVPASIVERASEVIQRAGTSRRSTVVKGV